MEITTKLENDIYTIILNGELDASSSIRLDMEMEKALGTNCHKILVDCEKLSYISSAGLGVFMSYLHDFDVKKISIALFNVSEKVKDVFYILGLQSLIRISNSKEEAAAFVNELHV
ncbi:MAG: STAS domain-containing protein [Cytophagales bacterium]|nr:STAS domain-containing protein [Cytophagales bacterium]